VTQSGLQLRLLRRRPRSRKRTPPAYAARRAERAEKVVTLGAPEKATKLEPLHAYAARRAERAEKVVTLGAPEKAAKFKQIHVAERGPLFSLKERMTLEAERIRSEEAERAATAAAREEAARLEAIRVAKVDMARIEAEQHARLEPMTARAADLSTLHTPRRDRSWLIGVARSARATFTAKKVSGLLEVPEAMSPSLRSSTPPWVRAYRPSWILPRRQSSVHIYVFMPEARERVRKEAHAALDAAGNPARESHAIPLHRSPDELEPLVVHVELPGFEVGRTEPMLWRPPYVRFVVPVVAHADVALGVHRPLVTLRSGRASGELLSTFDFDLPVRASSPRASMVRGALSGGGLALALAAVMATEQHALPPAVGWPFGAACLAGGASAFVMMQPLMAPAHVRDQSKKWLADVLIVTAVKDEYQAVLAVDTGAAPRSAWEKRTGSTRLEVAFRNFATDRGLLRIAVTQALGMGGVGAVNAAAQLVQDYKVHCLAMCGVCAGRRGEVALGDVLVADRLWQYDTGKRKAEIDAHGQRAPREQGDIDMYRIQPPEWLHAAERFQVDPTAPWLALRPRSYESQGDWILERLLTGADPAADPAQSAMCENYDAALTRLWKRDLLRDGALELTDAGRARIQRILALNRDRLPEPKPLEIRVGPIASGNKVMEDAEIFPLLAGDVRKVLGVEMEAAAIGALAHARQLRHSVIMKAVMDHADPDKSDNFKPFAARASAECLIAFLRANLPPRELPAA
jgi:nucleoside phosphorylase